jgi:hypothetical protein
MSPYIGQLGLTDRQIFDAQGNALDRAIVGARAGRLLAVWAYGGRLPGHVYPDESRVSAIYQTMRRTLDNEGLGPVGQPLSPEVRYFLQRLPSPPSAGTAHGTPPTAAPGGREML